MFRLPKLPYPYDALEPHIDEETMKVHHGKHHAGYVSKLNDALKEHEELQGQDIESILGNIENVEEDIRQKVINSGGGHTNHSLFWEIMSPKGGGQPEGDLAKALDNTFGDFETFKENFSEKAATLFGSGWAFLMVTRGKRLALKRHSFQNSPIMHGNIPILGLDVWEHAYYLKYQNRRGDYIKAFWNVVSWDEVEKRFKVAVK
ncbi:MAG: superoxide dismutase [Candidatus Woesebacteria bacterium]|jgi:Fe-Mn family superoxide dismutase